jgi:acyl carrier protein
MTDAGTLTSADLHERIMQIVAKEGAVELDSIKPEAKLSDTQLVSADLIMVLMAIEEEFDVYVPVDGPLSEAETVGDVIDVIVEHIKSQQG